MKRKTIDGASCRELREKLGLNQSQFWGCLGVSQSGGCRYESGRTVPRPVRKLVWLVYVSGVDQAVLERMEKI